MCLPGASSAGVADAMIKAHFYVPYSCEMGHSKFDSWCNCCRLDWLSMRIETNGVWLRSLAIRSAPPVARPSSRLGARYCGARPLRLVHLPLATLQQHPRSSRQNCSLASQRVACIAALYFPGAALPVSPPGLVVGNVLLRRRGRLEHHRVVWLDVLMSEIHGHHCFAVVFLLR